MRYQKQNFCCSSATAAFLFLSLFASLPADASAKSSLEKPWLDTKLDPDQRANLVLKQMSQDEKLKMVFGFFSTKSDWVNNGGVKNFVLPSEGIPYSAGFVAGIPRLGIPNQWETDAGLGVATQASPSPRLRTSLPSGLSTAATWSPETAFAGGAMIGNEARLSGFNVQLAGGVNLLRDPRNGRNFEYAGEDPLLAGTIVGNEIKGIQSNHIISTMKHFAFNDQETNRFTINATIGEAAGRQSDLLAFELANEIGNPGSVMCAYNRVNGFYACENDYLLNKVLKHDWKFKGYVMSDWGATHSTVAAANNGLDQQSGWAFDRSPYFEGALKEAVNDGFVAPERLDDMVKRILRSMFANGIFEDPVSDKSALIDFAAHAEVSEGDAEQGIVLLKNMGVLPIAKTVKTIAVIGGHADKGVLSGAGSSQVYPLGGPAIPDEWGKGFPGPKVFFPSSPVEELKAYTSAKITYIDGKDSLAAAKLASKSDIVIIFATQWIGESKDAPSLSLPDGQDELIEAVARANNKTIVVLENGGPVLMPWLNSVPAVVEAWYPGTSGGKAIARILSGEVNPSGHLPVTFPSNVEQLPRPKMDGDASLSDDDRPTTSYDIEGAAVGYKWFDLKRLNPLFPFGYGMSYTTFKMGDLKVDGAETRIQVSFQIKNLGHRSGSEVAQIYISANGWEAPKRLAAFKKVFLEPQESRSQTVTIDPRLLSIFDPISQTWKIKEGDYVIMLGESERDIVQSVKVHLDYKEMQQ